MSEIDKLKKLYGNGFADQPESVDTPSDYEWFKIVDGPIFGIRSDRLSDKERQLLRFSFSPYFYQPLNRSKAQQKWANVLFNAPKSTDHDDDLPSIIGLGYFYVHHFDGKPHDLPEAVRSYFGRDCQATVWINDHEGVIVVDGRHIYTFDELIDLLATDLYCDLSILSVTDESSENVSEHLAAHRTLFRIARELSPEKRSFDYIRLLPLMLTQAFEKAATFDIGVWLERFRSLPPELIKSLAVFFQHDFNLSTAAHSLYIHRNSLQYRLDRVHQLTGLDPKHFPDAVILFFLMQDDRYKRRIGHPDRQTD